MNILEIERMINKEKKKMLLPFLMPSMHFKFQTLRCSRTLVILNHVRAGQHLEILKKMKIVRHKNFVVTNRGEDLHPEMSHAQK